jgi:glycosyltransferase involved in cell wall biosynthesis
MSDDREKSRVGSDTRPVISIVTVCFNDVSALGATIKSIEAQDDLSRAEILIIDGGSTDGSVDMLTAYAARQPVARVVSERDTGIYNAMNKAIHLARSDYVYFLNAGDTLAETNTIGRIISDLGASTALWAVGHVFHSDYSRLTTSLPFDRWRFFWGRQGYNHQGVLVRLDFMRALGGFDEEFGYAADLGVLFRASLCAAPLELNYRIANYLGSGYSASRVFSSPLEFHRLRVATGCAPLVLRNLSFCVAFLQIARRSGIRSARRAMVEFGAGLAPGNDH